MIYKLTIVTLFLVFFQSNIVEGQKETSLLLAKNVNKFSINLHQVLKKITNKNAAFSAVSAWSVLSMASCGSNGSTKMQFYSSLQYTHNNFSYALIELNENLNNGEASKLIMANKIFLAESIKIKPKFSKAIKIIFNSTVEKIDFSKAQNVSKVINKWVENKTNSSIMEIVKPNDFGRNTKLVLVNTISFKYRWANTFIESRTQLKSFKLNKRENIIVPTMTTELFCNTGSLDYIFADFIVLPFTDYFDKEKNADSMLIILPQEVMNINYVKKNMNEDDIQTIYENKPNIKYVRVSLPKFNITNNINFVQSMKDLGMTDMFGSAANFSRISDTPLFIDKIVQKVAINVDENGCSASRATSMSTNDRISFSEPEVFEVNRPFLAFIIRKGTIIFTAQVVDPTK